MRSTSILLEEHWEKRESSTTWYQLEIKGAGAGLPASSMEIVMDCVYLTAVVPNQRAQPAVPSTCGVEPVISSGQGARGQL